MHTHAFGAHGGAGIKDETHTSDSRLPRPAHASFLCVPQPLARPCATIVPACQRARRCGPAQAEGYRSRAVNRCLRAPHARMASVALARPQHPFASHLSTAMPCSAWHVWGRTVAPTPPLGCASAHKRAQGSPLSCGPTPPAPCKGYATRQTHPEAAAFSPACVGVPPSVPAMAGRGNSPAWGFFGQGCAPLQHLQNITHAVCCRRLLDGRGGCGREAQCRLPRSQGGRDGSKPCTTYAAAPLSVFRHSSAHAQHRAAWAQDKGAGHAGKGHSELISASAPRRPQRTTCTADAEGVRRARHQAGVVEDACG